MDVGTFMNKNKTGFGNECRNAWWEEKSLCAQKQISIQPYISVLRFIVFILDKINTFYLFVVHLEISNLIDIF